MDRADEIAYGMVLTALLMRWSVIVVFVCHTYIKMGHLENCDNQIYFCSKYSVLVCACVSFVSVTGQG